MSRIDRGVNAGHDLAHARMQRRIVEHQARRVVLEQQPCSVLGRELALLVGGKSLRVLVDGNAGGVAGQKISAIRHSMDRARIAQRVVVRIGIGIVVTGQPAQVESMRGGNGLCSVGKARRRAGCAGSLRRLIHDVFHVPLSAAEAESANPQSRHFVWQVYRPVWRAS